MAVSHQTKNRTTYDPAIPLLGTCLKKTKTQMLKHTCTPMFIAALFTTAKIGKQPEYPSTDEWIKKMWYIYIHTHTHKMEYFLSHKKKWNSAICRHMDGPGGHYAKWNKTDK